LYSKKQPDKQLDGCPGSTALMLHRCVTHCNFYSLFNTYRAALCIFALLKIWQLKFGKIH
jgi:cytosine/uracil/thiamine/allantoin permease